MWLRQPCWWKCTLARSTAGHWSPLPIVSPAILKVADAERPGLAIAPVAGSR